MTTQVDILSAQGGFWLSLYEACPGLMMHFSAASVAEMVRAYRAMEDRLRAAEGAVAASAEADRGARAVAPDASGARAVAPDASGARAVAPDAPPDCLRWRCRRADGDACPGCPYVGPSGVRPFAPDASGVRPFAPDAQAAPATETETETETETREKEAK